MCVCVYIFIYTYKNVTSEDGVSYPFTKFSSLLFIVVEPALRAILVYLGSCQFYHSFLDFASKFGPFSYRFWFKVGIEQLFKMLPKLYTISKYCFRRFRYGFQSILILEHSKIHERDVAHSTRNHNNQKNEITLASTPNMFFF